MTKEKIIATESSFIVKSPLVALFQRALINEGDKVSKGQSLCVIDANGLKVEVTAEVDGIVCHIFVDSASPVVYGTELMDIEPC